MSQAVSETSLLLSERNEPSPSIAAQSQVLRGVSRPEEPNVLGPIHLPQGQNVPKSLFPPAMLSSALTRTAATTGATIGSTKHTSTASVWIVAIHSATRLASRSTPPAMTAWTVLWAAIFASLERAYPAAGRTAHLGWQRKRKCLAPQRHRTTIAASAISSARILTKWLHIGSNMPSWTLSQQRDSKSLVLLDQARGIAPSKDVPTPSRHITTVLSVDIVFSDWPRCLHININISMNNSQGRLAQTTITDPA